MPPRLIAALVSVSAVLVACGRNDDPSIVGEPSGATTTTVTARAVGEHNDADVQFVQAMIPRLQDAVAMAALADGRASSPKVLDLAARIEDAQQAEIDTMQGWLAVWGGLDAPSETSEGGGGGGTNAGTGTGVVALQATSDSAFDRTFLEKMIDHHGGVIELANQEIADGKYTPALELAREIVHEQKAEIDQMQQLLKDVGG